MKIYNLLFLTLVCFYLVSCQKMPNIEGTWKSDRPFLANDEKSIGKANTAFYFYDGKVQLVMDTHIEASEKMCEFVADVSIAVHGVYKQTSDSISIEFTDSVPTVNITNADIHMPRELELLAALGGVDMKEKAFKAIEEGLKDVRSDFARGEHITFRYHLVEDNMLILGKNDVVFKKEN